MKTPSVRKQDLDQVLSAIKDLRTELQGFISEHTQSDKEAAIKQALMEQKIEQIEKDLNALGSKIEKDGVNIDEINRRIYAWAGGLAVGSLLLSLFGGFLIERFLK